MASNVGNICPQNMSLSTIFHKGSSGNKILKWALKLITVLGVVLSICAGYVSVPVYTGIIISSTSLISLLAIKCFSRNCLGHAVRNSYTAKELKKVIQLDKIDFYQACCCEQGISDGTDFVYITSKKLHGDINSYELKDKIRYLLKQDMTDEEKKYLNELKAWIEHVEY